MRSQARLNEGANEVAGTEKAGAPVAEIFGPPAVLLVVTDDRKREKVRVVLEARGLRCEATNDADQALAAVVSNRAIGIVILDSKGLASPARAFVRVLRRQARRPLAAILLSTAPSLDVLREIASAGPADILSETPSEAELIASVQKTLGWSQRTQHMGGAPNNVMDMLAHIEARLGALTALAPSGAGVLFTNAPAPEAASGRSTAVDHRMIKTIMGFHAAQQKILGSGLLDDAAWVMLLDLLLMHIERRPLAVTALCVGAGVPMTTALRRLDQLIAKGLVQKSSDLSDRRRMLVSITPKGVESVCSILERLWGAYDGADTMHRQRSDGDIVMQQSVCSVNER